MLPPRTPLLLASAVLGVLAPAARPDHLTYSLSDVLSGEPLPVGSVTFADVSSLRPAPDRGRFMDPTHVYFSPRLTPDRIRRAPLAFDALATAPAHLTGAFPGKARPIGGGTGDLFLVREKLRPLPTPTGGNLPTSQKDFSDSITLIYLAEETVRGAADGHDTGGGGMQRLSQAPEPPTLTLLTLGAVGLLGAYWRQRRLELP